MCVLIRLLQCLQLFLCNNKITKVENLELLVNVSLLELGSNRIRVWRMTALYGSTPVRY
jgi:hypothetical protein